MKRMLMRKPASNMAGLTLLETMFGIAIGALILIAAVIFYTSTKNSQNVSKATTDINTIVAAADNYIAPGSDAVAALASPTTGDALNVLQGVGYLPTPMSDPWGQNYAATVSQNTAVGAGIPGTITITVTSLKSTDQSCAAIAASSQGSAGATKGTDDGNGGTTGGGECTITRNL